MTKEAEKTAQTEIELESPFCVTDLKQWLYCPRILYYRLCLPDVRPTTYKMQMGSEEGKAEEIREARRSLKIYGVEDGHREFNVVLSSERYGLRGKVDLVIWRTAEVIPVDYKFSNIAGQHFQLQLMAYGLLLEEISGLTAQHGFLYMLPKRNVMEVKFVARLREKLLGTLELMHRMLYSELVPPPTQNQHKCLACEFRRFCNDV
ncbi:MAG: CRISPR-associated protein Cas4 [Anaerolineaceae bacterium]|jgi:CRISPR-associated exonuclease Cas4|nr:MAG: CRISPR-associated protein Cas4 [Anaerolineaceae bacterium]